MYLFVEFINSYLGYYLAIEKKRQKRQYPFSPITNLQTDLVYHIFKILNNDIILSFKTINIVL